MISKQGIKFIKSLQFKKYRIKTNSFIVEGEKSVLEVLQSEFKIKALLTTPKFLSNWKHHLKSPDVEITEINTEDLARLGTLKVNDHALAVVEMPGNVPFSIKQNEFVIALDSIQDPGNLGTIIRTADWFGINKILASTETVDLYNPKVISSTKGSFTRVKLHYCNLLDYLNLNKGIKVYGADTRGKNIDDVSFSTPAIMLLGNESHGISRELSENVHERITIPRHGKAESLNVAIANAIICHHWASRAHQ